MEICKKDIDRFWNKVAIGSQDECWEWTASISTNGYGRFWIGRKLKQAHRIAWQIYNKEHIPLNFVICHSCDNKKCVNPHHLFIGTQADNMQDCITKGRFAPIIKFNGEGHPRSKLKEKTVIKLREDFKNVPLGNRKMFIQKMAKTNGVAAATIRGIVYNQHWRK